MKTLAMAVAIILVAAAAGFGGAYVNRLMEPQPVHAQRARATAGVRIALCNIERAAKASRVFAQKKTLYENAQKELQRQRDEIQGAMTEANRKIESEGMDPNVSQEDMAHLSIALEVLKEKLKDAKDKHELYLTRILTAYQNDVLKEVRTVVETFAATQGYDIVLQDYTVDAATSGQFFDGSYAQTLLNKPVFYVPDLENNKNLYVTDITEAVISKVK